MLMDCPAIDTPSSTTRSAVTNGSARFLGKVDGRSALARRQRDLQRAYAEQLGGNLTASQRVRVGQVAALTVRAELLQSAVALGDSGIDEDLVRVTNALRRELADLGLAGRSNTTPPSPADDKFMALVRRTLTPQEGTNG